MDWAARFIDSIYNRLDNSIYVMGSTGYYRVYHKRTIEAMAKQDNMRVIYDEIRKTARFEK